MLLSKVSAFNVSVQLRIFFFQSVVQTRLGRRILSAALLSCQVVFCQLISWGLVTFFPEFFQFDNFKTSRWHFTQIICDTPVVLFTQDDKTESVTKCRGSWVSWVKKSIEKNDKVKELKNKQKTKISDSLIARLFTASFRPLPDISLSTWDLGPLSLHHCTKDMLLMKIYRYVSDHREISDTDVKYVETCNSQKVWDSYDSLNGDSCFNLLPRAGCSCLYTIINLNSMYVYSPNDQRRLFKGTGSRFSACSLIKMMFFCRDILYRL